MKQYPKRGGDCEYTMDCPWGVDGWCDRPSGNKCEIQKMDEATEKIKANTLGAEPGGKTGQIYERGFIKC